MSPCGLRHLARAEPTRHTIDRPVTERANGATGESNGRAEAELLPRGSNMMMARSTIVANQKGK
jgi:hypothetical protein